MTPSQIITEARKLTATDSANYTDAQGIIDFNIVYQDVISDVISELDEDYFWNQIKADTVANQNEYTIDDTETSPNFRINHVNKVAIKYGANDSYTDATRINPNDMERDEDFYETNQPKTSPIYYVADNSVFVFPKPTDAVTEGLKLTVILQPNNLTTSSAETDIAVQPRFHKVIIAGMRARIFGQRRLINEELQYSQVYDSMKRDMIAQMRARNQGTIQIVTGDLSNFA